MGQQRPVGLDDPALGRRELLEGGPLAAAGGGGQVADGRLGRGGAGGGRLADSAASRSQSGSAAPAARRACSAAVASSETRQRPSLRTVTTRRALMAPLDWSARRRLSSAAGSSSLAPRASLAADGAAGQLDHGHVGAAEAGHPLEADVAGGQLEPGQRLAGGAGHAAVQQRGGPVPVGVDQHRLLAVEVAGGARRSPGRPGRCSSPAAAASGEDGALGGGGRLAGGVQADPAEQQQHGDQAGHAARGRAAGRLAGGGCGVQLGTVGCWSVTSRSLSVAPSLKDRPSRRSRWGWRRSTTVGAVEPNRSSAPPRSALGLAALAACLAMPARATPGVPGPTTLAGARAEAARLQQEVAGRDVRVETLAEAHARRSRGWRG